MNWKTTGKLFFAFIVLRSGNSRGAKVDYDWTGANSAIRTR